MKESFTLSLRALVCVFVCTSRRRDRGKNSRHVPKLPKSECFEVCWLRFPCRERHSYCLACGMHSCLWLRTDSQRRHRRRGWTEMMWEKNNNSINYHPVLLSHWIGPSNLCACEAFFIKVSWQWCHSDRVVEDSFELTLRAIDCFQSSTASANLPPIPLGKIV